MRRLLPVLAVLFAGCIGLATMAYGRGGVEITGGEVWVNGRDILKSSHSDIRNLRGGEVAYVSQSAAASFNPAKKIMDQVVEAAVEPYRNGEVSIVIEPQTGHPPEVPRSPEVLHGLANLTENAVDFSRRQVRVEIYWDTPEITILLEDDGPGFQQDVLKTLGEPYTTTRRQRGGMGLGVFIATTLLGHSGATVDFSNRVENGELVPYHRRAGIDAGALDGRRLEIVYVDDPVDAFFLHIQGSGRVLLDSGEELRLGYAAQNGHGYFAIGRELIRRGALTRETVSMQSIRAWLASHPDQAAEVMELNGSYVFFRELQGAGPIGAGGVALTPERSLAVDRRFIPLGAPVWLDAAAPVAEGGDRTLRRLLVAQDTGGAIKGAVRGDLYFGTGDAAGSRADTVNAPGRMWVLLPRAVAERIRMSNAAEASGTGPVVLTP